MILKEMLFSLAATFEGKGITNHKSQAEELIAMSLGLKRSDLYLSFEKILSDVEKERIFAVSGRRIKGEPIQQIARFVEFLSCSIEINRDVLIPRQETEVLTAKVVESLACLDKQQFVVWDLCSGSGCIAIAIKKHFPDCTVIGSDICPAALGVAEKNAEQNGVSLKFLQGDLLEPFRGQKADVIICNPPYIPESEWRELDSEVKDYEPKIALVAKDFGLAFYKRLAKSLPDYLNVNGKVFLEIGHDQGSSVIDIFKAPCWKVCRFEKDWSSKDRFFFLEL